MDENPYIRIGTNYFKFIDHHLASGDVVRTLDIWSKTIIREDHGNGIFSKIPKYDSYTVIPNNTNYQRVIGVNPKKRGKRIL